MSCNSYTKARIDLVGSCFVEFYYKVLYESAKDSASISATSSLTDTYRDSVRVYASSVRTLGNIYQKTVSRLHTFYHRYLPNEAVTVQDFEKALLGLFIPKEYLKNFANSHCDHAIRRIITHVTAFLAQATCEPRTLRSIIDDHVNTHNVKLLQASVHDSLVSLRDQFYSEFVTATLQDRHGRPEIESLRKQYNKVAEENTQLKRALLESMKIARSLQLELDALREPAEKLARQRAARNEREVAKFAPKPRAPKPKQLEPRIAAVPPKQREIDRDISRYVIDEEPEKPVVDEDDGHFGEDASIAAAVVAAVKTRSPPKSRPALVRQESSSSEERVSSSSSAESGGEDNGEDEQRGRDTAPKRKSMFESDSDEAERRPTPDRLALANRIGDD